MSPSFYDHLPPDHEPFPPQMLVPRGAEGRGRRGETEGGTGGTQRLWGPSRPRPTEAELAWRLLPTQFGVFTVGSLAG